MKTSELALQYNKSQRTIQHWFKIGKLFGRRSGTKGRWRLANNQLRKGETI